MVNLPRGEMDIHCGPFSCKMPSDSSYGYPVHDACRLGLLHSLDAFHSHYIRNQLIIEEPSTGWTPMHFAAYYGQLDCVQVLCQSFEMSPDLPNFKYKQRPIHLAAYGNQRPVLLWLIESGGADINSQDYLGESAVHKAARGGSTDCLQVLHSKGAAFNIANNSNLMASQIARSCGHLELADHLAQFEAQQQVSEERSNSEDIGAGCPPSNGCTNGIDRSSAISNILNNTSPLSFAHNNGFGDGESLDDVRLPHSDSAAQKQLFTLEEPFTPDQPYTPEQVIHARRKRDSRRMETLEDVGAFSPEEDPEDVISKRARLDTHYNPHPPADLSLHVPPMPPHPFFNHTASVLPSEDCAMMDLEDCRPTSPANIFTHSTSANEHASALRMERKYLAAYSPYRCSSLNSHFI